MTDLIKDIVAPQIEFEGEEKLDRFVKIFCDLYRIELFKDGLDLILTKLKQKELRFEVKIIKDWDTNVGCFLTENSGAFGAAGLFGKLVRRKSLKITIRSLNYNVLAHEMAHALEFESGLSLGEDFRSSIGYDVNGRNPENIALKGEIKRLMVDALKSYPQSQFISELFARYFELLSISRNVVSNGDFTTFDVMDFFANSTKFVSQIFNTQIRAKIDQEISAHTIEIANRVKIEKPEKKFSEQVNSKHSGSDLSWSRGIKSNASWHQAWQKNIEEDKNSK